MSFLNALPIMASTKESRFCYHSVLVLIFIFVSISSQDKICGEIVDMGDSEMSIEEIKERVNFSKTDAQNPNDKSDSTSKNCSKHVKLDDKLQPKSSNIANVKKCCPVGQIYQRTSDMESAKCVAGPNVKFEPPIKEAVLYDGCQELSKNIKLNYAIGDPCNHNISEYSEDFNDEIYVIQNGSLLIKNGDITYGIYDTYCVDNIQYAGRSKTFLSAFLCNQTFDQPMSSNYSYFQYLYATYMLASVPCLLSTAFFYFFIPRLSNIYGKSLACHSLCTAIACLFFGVAKFEDEINRSTGLTIQYFFLSCYFWLFIMCSDICLQVWYFIPQKIVTTPKTSFMRFFAYVTIAFVIPAFLVYLMASSKDIGATQLMGPYSTIMAPISIILLTSFALLVASYFGFRKWDPIALKLFFERNDMEEEPRLKKYLRVKQSAISTAFLSFITTMNQTSSIISFYMKLNSSIVMFDVLNAVHGVVVFIIFVCRPRPMAIIRDWWHGREQLKMRMTEIVVLTDSSN